MKILIHLVIAVSDSGKGFDYAAYQNNVNDLSDSPDVDGPVTDSRMSSGGGQEIRIVIADDHPTMREGLANMLKHKDNLKIIVFVNDG